MASLNKVMLIGRLTRDVESRTFQNGGKVAKFGFAVTGRRVKNQQTGQWENEPCFLDVQAFNRGEYGRLADICEQYLSKGRECFIEGHLQMESWTTKQGEKRNKITVVADNVQFTSKDREREGFVMQEEQPPPRTSQGYIGQVADAFHKNLNDDSQLAAPSYAPDSVHDELPF